MCGICGIKYRSAVVEPDVISRMTEVLHHRGPDDRGVHTDANIGLGQTRLSIIDVSSAGHQPMCNEDQSVWLVFNGEIYNFQTLKKRLLEKGHVFRSHTDSETIIHLWEEMGPQCVEKLNGMFALALWDKKKDTLFLARDRIGKKPLFYMEGQDGTFAWASEIKALQQIPSFKAEPDMLSIHYYLAFQSVPAPYCAFKGVRKLPPAHYLLYQNNKASLQRYWEFSYEDQFRISSEKEEIDLQHELIERLKEAIRKRMVSDVPIGSFLSGGIDSSLVSALMAQMCPEPIRTFSIGFEEEEYDETKFAKLVSRRYGTRHTVFVVKPNIHEILDDLVWHYNEPFADSSAIPTFYLSRLASRQVKVVLTGDAGDENFGGYPRYQKAISPSEKFWGYSLLLALWRNFRRIGYFHNRCNSWMENLQRQLRINDRMLAYYFCITHFHEHYQHNLYTDQMWEAVGKNASVDFMLDKYAHFRQGSFLDKTLGVDLTMYMPDTLMVKTDIASMAHGLEARSPMLDHEFVEFAAKIPASLKLKDNKIGKYILKKASEPYLPQEVIYRPKMGFGVPLNHWFRNELKDFTYDVLLDKNAFIAGWLRQDYIKTLLDRHQSIFHENWQYVIWNLLFLELWFKRFFKG